MKSLLLSILLLAVVVYVVVGVFLYIFQRDFIYSPTTTSCEGNAENIEITSQQEVLDVLRINSNQSEAIIYFGGNVEDVSCSIDDFNHRFKKHSSYLVNYRGYGGSSGKPSEKAFYTDALAIYDQLKGEHNKISVIGRSLGSGVAVYLAAQREIDQLVLVTPYDSIEAISKKRYPVYPVSFMLKDKFDSYRHAKRVNNQTLVIIAEYDEIIPRQHTDRLLTQLPADKTRVVVMAEATHNLLNVDEQYMQILEQHFHY